MAVHLLIDYSIVKNMLDVNYQETLILELYDALKDAYIWEVIFNSAWELQQIIKINTEGGKEVHRPFSPNVCRLK